MSKKLHTLPIRAIDCSKLSYKLREHGLPLTPCTMNNRLQALKASGSLSESTVTQAAGRARIRTPYCVDCLGNCGHGN